MESELGNPDYIDRIQIRPREKTGSESDPREITGPGIDPREIPDPT